MPPDSFPARRLVKGPRRVKSSSSANKSACWLASMPRKRAYRRMFSITDKSSYRSEEHTSELQSLMRISYAVFCLNKKNHKQRHTQSTDDGTKQNREKDTN